MKEVNWTYLKRYALINYSTRKAMNGDVSVRVLSHYEF